MRHKMQAKPQTLWVFEQGWGEFEMIFLSDLMFELWSSFEFVSCYRGTA